MTHRSVQSSLVLASLVLAGCSHRADTSQVKGTDLERVVCTTYANVGKAAPCGAVVSIGAKEARRFFIVTAGHVVQESVKKGPSSDFYIGFSSRRDVHIMRRLKNQFFRIPYDDISASEYDLGCFEITGAVDALEANEGEIRSIDLGVVGQDLPMITREEPRVATAVGIALKKDYERLGIKDGSELKVIVSDIDMSLQSQGYNWNGVLKSFTGRLLHQDEMVQMDGKDRHVHIGEGTVKNGNSGGPVFAMVDVDGVKRPFLIGVVQGMVPGRNEFAFVPIDPIIEEILKKGDEHGVESR